MFLETGTLNELSPPLGSPVVPFTLFVKYPAQKGYPYYNMVSGQPSLCSPSLKTKLHNMEPQDIGPKTHLVLQPRCTPKLHTP